MIGKFTAVLFLTTATIPSRWNRYSFPIAVIFGRSCEAIAYAHSCRVMQLEIKLGNIQVGEFAEVKDRDCGWANPSG